MAGENAATISQRDAEPAERQFAQNFRTHLDARENQREIQLGQEPRRLTGNLRPK